MKKKSNSLEIIFAGTSTFAMHHLDALLSSGHKIIGVFTQPDRPAGRGKKLMSSPVKILAKEKGIPVFQPNSLRSVESQQIIANLNADIMLVVAYGLILPKVVLDMPRFGCINVHASLLPRWRGAAPIQRSLLAGDTKTGVTIIQMDIGVDTGNIIYSLPCLISEKDTSITLCEKLSKLGQRGLLDTLQKIVNGEVISKVQDESLVTYAEKLSKNEARIDWSLPATHLERCVRAFNPWPVSWVKMNEFSIRIWKASVIPITVKEKPGTIIKAKKNGIQVATVKGILNIEFLQPEGKVLMSAQDILNSYRERFLPGTRFT